MDHGRLVGGRSKSEPGWTDNDDRSQGQPTESWLEQPAFDRNRNDPD